MDKIFLSQDVFSVSQERLDFIFANFEKIYLSFSGGKDSGVMLNLTIDYMKKHNIKSKIGLMVMDNEANYTHSLEFMLKIIDDNIDYLDVYWCCLPIALPCTTSSFFEEWICWNTQEEEKWVNKMPDRDYVINESNHKFPFFKTGMSYEVFWDNFGEWYSEGKRTACMIGIRTDESLNRFRAIANKDKIMLDNKCWTKKNGKNVYNVYPIYDWRTNDIWIANAKFEWLYNKLYDIFYMAGMSVSQMRVASPFMSEGKSSLNMYKVIDEHIWRKLCLRVSGANFVAQYGKQLMYKDFTLPVGHTWKSFVKFLLNTLPDEVKKNYRARFIQSFKLWGRLGRGLSDDVIKDLQKNNIKFTINGVTAHGRKNKKRVVIKIPPDDLNCLKAHNSEVTSWKRFGITILKNDHTCKYMGLSPTKDQENRKKMIIKKYSKINEV